MKEEWRIKPLPFTKPEATSIDEWERAYQRFETPDQEIRKFTKRLTWFGAKMWPKQARVVEIFCGRGNGMVALERMGFQHLEGVDLSEQLLEQYHGPAKCIVADCRALPFENESRDIVVVQGGLHHLPTLPDDLDQVLSEVRRILVPGGMFVAVEPWTTLFLKMFHFGCSMQIARRLWSKLDAGAIMIEHEIETYSNWLCQPEAIMKSFDQFFLPIQRRTAWGKLYFLGKPVQV